MLVAVAGAVALGEWSEGGVGRVPVRAGAAARDARDGAGARRDPRADGPGAGRGAGPSRRRRRARCRSTTFASATSIVVRPGEKIPLDGRVARRREPRQPGAGHRRVAAGREGARRRGVRRHDQRPRRARGRRSRGCARDSTLARIIHLVERAQAQRAPSQTFVDRFARIYTPAVLVLAVLVAVAGRRSSLGGAWSDWIYRALVLLVISCPCALVISTPVSIVSALAAAARKGVLIKGGARLERLAAVRCVAFDKTGTLTHGRLRVVDVVPLERRARRRKCCALAASLETRSEHPIGRAIVEHAPPSERRARRRRRVPGAARPRRRGAGRTPTASSSATTGCSRSAACARPTSHARARGAGRRRAAAR